MSVLRILAVPKVSFPCVKEGRLGIFGRQLWPQRKQLGIHPCNHNPIGLVERFQSKPSPSRVPMISVNPGFPALLRGAKRVGEAPAAYLMVIQPA